jgi:hypothetical protein
VRHRDDGAVCHIHSVDHACIDMPRQASVASTAVRVIADPAGTQGLARAHFQQPPFDYISHGLLLYENQLRICTAVRDGATLNLESTIVNSKFKPGDYYFRRRKT